MEGSEIITIIQYVAIMVLFFEFVYATLQKTSEMQKYVIMLTIATILMFVGYIIEIRAVNLEEALAGTAVAYLGKPFVMFSSFMLICSFFQKKIPRWLIAVMIIWALFFSVLVFTNNKHHLYYASASFEDVGEYSPLIITRGSLYFSYMATTIVYFLACIYVIVSGYKNSKRSNRKEIAVYSLLMCVSGIVGYAFYLTGKTNGYDSTMLGVFGGACFLFIMSIRCRIFDILTIAKDFALDNSPTGLLVYDETGALVYKNNIVDEMVDGKTLTEIMLSTPDEHTKVTIDDKTYDILTKELIVNNVYHGKAIEISDITYYQNYQNILEREVSERTEKLEQIQHEVIASVASIVEARNVETGEHILRTSNYTRMIAEELRELGYYKDILTDEYIKMLVSAAPLHDIGKIAVPDAILLKPGRLTPEEFEVMKTHVDIGAEIVESTMQGLESEEYVAMAKDIVQGHHERWDGKGYSKHLKGEEIPLSARIVALADCFDAISSKRCYKDAIERREALAIIQEESGTHFEPNIVHAFMKALESGKYEI